MSLLRTDNVLCIVRFSALRVNTRVYVEFTNVVSQSCQVAIVQAQVDFLDANLAVYNLSVAS